MEKINPDWQRLQHPMKEQGRQREGESYPLSGDLAQPPADTADRRRRPHGVADQSDEDSKRCFGGDKALKVGK